MKKRVALLLVLTLLLSMLPTVALATEKETPVEKTSGLMENAEENLDSTTTEPRESAPEAKQPDEPESSKSAVLAFMEDSNAPSELVDEETENVSAEDGFEQVVPVQDETLAQEPDLAGEDVVASGTCGDQGDNLTWTLDSVGTLTISGSGDMQNFEPYGNSYNLWAPWQPYRDEIQCVVIKNGVTSIGSYSFDGCVGLEQVSIPNSIDIIAECAFGRCTSMTSISIPKGVTNIGIDAFWKCSSLSNITIPDSVTSIGAGAFQGCSGLKEITLPDSVVNIGVSAFLDCSSLLRVKLPQNLSKVPDLMFEGCKNLQEITIPDSVTSIGERAFANCSSLSSIQIPDGCQMGSRVFDGCTALLDQNGFMILDQTLVQYSGTAAQVIVPDGVQKIGESAFESNYRLTSVQLPETVTEISAYAFYDCPNLTDVVIPEECTIGAQAFLGCDGLADEKGFVILSGVLFDYLGSDTAVAVPDGVTRIDQLAFQEFSWDSWHLAEVIFPDSLQEIGQYAFSGCDQLTRVVIPENVAQIGDGAFAGCDCLASIQVVPENPFFTSVNGVLYDAAQTKLLQYPTGKELEQFEVPQGVAEISADAFYETSLREVTIPDSVVRVGAWAFYNTDVVTLSIGSGLTELGDQALSFCTQLQGIQVSEDNVSFKSEDGILFSKDGTELILYPSAKENRNYAIGSGVTTVAYAAFANASNLASVSIPKSVSSIGAWAFADTSISEVRFQGDAPMFESYIDEDGEDWGLANFGGSTLTAYYPENNKSWSGTIVQFHGGKVTWEPYVLQGVAVSGTITSWEQDSEASYLLYDAALTDAEIRADLALETPQLALSVGSGGTVGSGSGGSYEQTFTFDGVEAGTYKLAICKSAKYVPQVVTVTVGDGDIELGNLSLRPAGDTSGDGAVTIIDAALANSYARGTGELEGYALACADVSGNDGKVTIIDAARINAHARGTASLWD